MLSLLDPFKKLPTLNDLFAKPTDDNQASKPVAHEMGFPKIRQHEEKLRPCFGKASAFKACNFTKLNKTKCPTKDRGFQSQKHTRSPKTLGLRYLSGQYQKLALCAGNCAHELMQSLRQAYDFQIGNKLRTFRLNLTT